MAMQPCTALQGYQVRLLSIVVMIMQPTVTCRVFGIAMVPPSLSRL